MECGPPPGIPDSKYQDETCHDGAGNCKYFNDQFTVRCGDGSGYPTGRPCAAPDAFADPACAGLDTIVLCKESGNWALGSLKCPGKSHYKLQNYLFVTL